MSVRIYFTSLAVFEIQSIGKMAGLGLNLLELSLE